MRAASAPVIDATVVENRWRFQRRDMVLFGVLSVIQLAVFVLTIRGWIAAGVGRGGQVLLLVVPFVIGLVMLQARWLTLPLMQVPVHRPSRSGWRVGVATTFVPAAESIEMLEVTVRALVAMRYPHETWVLDEGDSDEVRALCAQLGCQHYSRANRPDRRTPSGEFAERTKHGNYNAWLNDHGYDRYDVIVNVDPDHIVEPEFLERTLGYLDDDRVGYVQAAQVYYNQSASLIARGAAEETYAYYSSIQMSSYYLGYPIVTGCHTVHRTTALQEIGGFCAHDADDLLSTLYYRSRGWRGVYVPEILALGLTPVDWPSYLAQQRRWASSVLDVKFRIYPRLAGKLPMLERGASLLHGLYYFQGVGSAFSLCVLCAVLIRGWHAHLGTALVVGPIAIFAVGLACDFFRQSFYLDRRKEWGVHWRAALLRFAKWPWILVALLDAIRGKQRSYSITRKTRAAIRSTPRVATVHITIAAAVITSAAIGAWRHATQPAALLALGGLYTAMAIAVASTELTAPASPFDPALAARRHRSAAE